MDKITVKEITNKNIWEKFILNYPDANFLQSWNWGEFHKNLGKEIRRTGFYGDRNLMGIVLSIVERAKRAIYLTVPGGPLIDWSNKSTVQSFRQIIEEVAKENGCSFVRVRPQILENKENAKVFKNLGFKIAPIHLHAELTRQLDLSKSEDDLLSEMRKTTRYEIKQATKQGIKIITSQDPKDIDEFYKLQMKTALRQEFVAFGKKFLTEQFRIFTRDNQVILYTAWLGKKKLAQAFVIFYGEEADYHYGASSEEGRKYPGAYLIQWEAIKEAKKRGIKRYNFWGVAPEGQTSHRFHGVSVFKRGFGGRDFEYLHARDLVINNVPYKINWLIETARRKIRKV